MRNKRMLLSMLAGASMSLIGMKSSDYAPLKNSEEKHTFSMISQLITSKKSNQEINKLIDQNKELTTAYSEYGNTLLMNAAWSGNLSAVRHILETGCMLGLDPSAAINYHNRELRGNTALTQATKEKHQEVVAYLLTQNPSQENIRYAMYETPPYGPIYQLLQDALYELGRKSKAKKTPPEQPKSQQEHSAPQAQSTSTQQPEASMPDFRPGATPRQVLGLPNTASLSDAKRAYRKLSLIYHPDKFNDNKALLAERGIYSQDQAKEAFTKISNAWDRLK